MVTHNLYRWIKWGILINGLITQWLNDRLINKCTIKDCHGEALEPRQSLAQLVGCL